MARFDLYRTRSTRIPYLLDVQAGLLDELASRTVIPVLPGEQVGAAHMSRLNPVIHISGIAHLLMTQEITTVPRETLRNRVGNLEATHRDAITAALDFLFQGY